MSEFDNLNKVAYSLKESDKELIVIYAPNRTGKTRLSLEYKNITKKQDSKGNILKQGDKDIKQTLYYNSYTEDLFYWVNTQDAILQMEASYLFIQESSLDYLLSKLYKRNSDKMDKRLKFILKNLFLIDIEIEWMITPNEESLIDIYAGLEDRIFARNLTFRYFYPISNIKDNEILQNFFEIQGESQSERIKGLLQEQKMSIIEKELYDNIQENHNNELDDRLSTPPIRISKGEETIIKFCFMLLLFEENIDNPDIHSFFIDDPISSLDDSYISSMLTLISTFIRKINTYNKKSIQKKKLIITTHHRHFFTLLRRQIGRSSTFEYKQLQNIEKGGFNSFLGLQYNTYTLTDIEHIQPLHIILIEELIIEFHNFLKSNKKNKIPFVAMYKIRSILESIHSFFNFHSDIEEIIRFILNKKEIDLEILNIKSNIQDTVHSFDINKNPYLDSKEVKTLFRLLYSILNQLPILVVKGKNSFLKVYEKHKSFFEEV